MNIKRAKEEIKNTIAAYFHKNVYGEYEIPAVRQRPVLLLGAPGIGKTQIMEQIARECGIGLVSYTITHHTRQSAIGLPFISEKEYGGRKYAVTEYTMSEIVASVYEKMEQTGLREGILFIDEINCVSETLAPAMLQFLQCKMFGNQAIPEGWLIVAAGNPPEYNKSVREFDVVTMDRVRKIEVEPDYEAWREYAEKENIHPAVLSYLRGRPSSFYQMERTVDGRQFATPRGWEDLSRILYVYEQLGKTADREVVIQYLQHEAVAREFAGYLELFYKYRTDYQIEEILQGRLGDAMLRKLSHAAFDERMGVVGLLLARCAKEFRAYGQLRERLQKLHEILRDWIRALEGAHREQPLVYLDDYMERRRQEWERLLAGDLLGREGEHLWKEVQEILEQILLQIRREGVSLGEQAAGVIREAFAARQEACEEAYGQAGRTLERAFDFMEAAFGQGQELVLFVTELNTGYYAVRFLQEYDCERYYRYNRELLFEEKRQKLLREIEEL